MKVKGLSSIIVMNIWLYSEFIIWEPRWSVLYTDDSTKNMQIGLQPIKGLFLLKLPPDAEQNYQKWFL